ncbi:alpha/beta fold hydrolase [uncultured Croceitalea sp.]|uniref:alpha/beta fold hydrolase n=1 Tax=uncultured Croceitalea sp. TaxID=1798908 RepID=UPI00374F4A0F
MVLNKKSIKCYFVLLLLSINANVLAQINYFNSYDGNKIAYTDEGKGFPVLLIHGFINTSASWNKTELKKDLLENGYRVIAPDLRGNGDSDKPHKDEAYTNDAEIEDLILLANKLELNNYIAIGYSRGSVVLTKLLTRDKRITKAVLGGMGIDFTNPNWDRRLLFAAAFDGKITKETKGAVDYAKSIGADLRALHLQQKYQPVTSKKELSRIETKILVIAGDKDMDNGNPKYLQEAILNAKFRIVEGDHNGTYKTKSFALEVIKFLSK